MKKSQTDLDFNAAPAEGENKGVSVLWWAAFKQQWGLVKEIMKSQGNLNFNAAPAEDKDRSVLKLLEEDMV